MTQIAHCRRKNETVRERTDKDNEVANISYSSMLLRIKLRVFLFLLLSPSPSPRPTPQPSPLPSSSSSSSSANEPAPDMTQHPGGHMVSASPDTPSVLFLSFNLFKPEVYVIPLVVRDSAAVCTLGVLVPSLDKRGGDANHTCC